MMLYSGSFSGLKVQLEANVVRKFHHCVQKAQKKTLARVSFFMKLAPLTFDPLRISPRAEEAVQKGNNVLSDARDTLSTLQDFETRVTENKDAAEQAMADIASIDDMIKSAQLKTAEARRVQ